ncbi:hypothetical protein BB560_001967 [Smittium megazygosporum]|uniref:UDP-glucose 4-epimerase n=1 Tax=Smittium megazygosporum TaxID=133381 RepID=A0A2T9ZG18_9FUNG|nr:hypothetical protein BB560_001967 [Smittium megazygosporum]
MKDSYVLVTGGTGFIGSFTALELLMNGYKVVVIDNLTNSSVESLNRIKKLANLKEDIPFFKVDFLDIDALENLFNSYKFYAVVHTAALKSVGESVQKPLLYYENNLCGTINLLKVMKTHNVKNIVFSSSATVYKQNLEGNRLVESDPLGCVNPYGRSKLFTENMITDVADSEPGWACVLLRYFNPTGAHPSGEMGEDPRKVPSNLVPYVSQVAVGKLEKVHVFGTDYNTTDGTGVRDYIHILDLAKAHVLALEKILVVSSSNKSSVFTYNLGTGTGYSVLQIINAMSESSGRKIPHVFDPRRKGDVDTVICNPSLAEKELGFKAKYGLKEMCDDLWKWQSCNPNGYQ